MEIILASGSPRRRELMEQIGISVLVIPSMAEENVHGLCAEETVRELAVRKCREVAGRPEISGCVIGADTVVVLDGTILGKPASAEDAFRMLSALQGRSHRVFTGVAAALTDRGEICKERSLVVCTEVHVLPMTDGEIRSYIATGEPMDKAGAYGIQGRFARWVERIEGDYFNVVGLPVSALCRMLDNMNVL